jgi:NADP-dependent 3-hydroxy acid dehydrogenase YdfG
MIRNLLIASKKWVFTYATMRNLGKSKNIIEIAITEKLPSQVVQLDVNDDRSIKDAISKIADEQEAIDVLVNNAGYALFGPIEELSIQEFKEQFKTNVSSVIIYSCVLCF